MPVIPPEQDLSNWVNVDNFIAVGDGITDDTAAIQKAMNSGSPAILCNHPARRNKWPGKGIIIQQVPLAGREGIRYINPSSGKLLS